MTIAASRSSWWPAQPVISRGRRVRRAILEEWCDAPHMRGLFLGVDARFLLTGVRGHRASTGATVKCATSRRRCGWRDAADRRPLKTFVLLTLRCATPISDDTGLCHPPGSSSPCIALPGSLTRVSRRRCCAGGGKQTQGSKPNEQMMKAPIQLEAKPNRTGLPMDMFSPSAPVPLP